MENAVELTAREGGLLPLWLVLAAVILWIVGIVVSSRYLNRFFPELSRDLGALGALVLGHVLFFWRPLFTAAHVPKGGGDLSSFFFALHAYSAERVTSWEIPLWNPYLHGGMPHLGNYQAGVLYPPNLIAYLVVRPFSYGTLEWLALLHFLIASIGLYLLLRSLGSRRIGAVGGGLVFAHSGFMVAHLGHYSMISVAAWVPWLLWAVHRIDRTPSWSRTALLAILIFLAATGGHQQTLLFALVGVGLWWLFLVARGIGIRVPGVCAISVQTDRPHHNWRAIFLNSLLVRVLQFGGAVAVGIGLAMPMLLPSLQLARRSVRSSLTYEQATEFSVQPVALLQLILPTVFGSNPTDHWGHFSSGEIWGYTGVVTLIIALIGLLLRGTSTRLFFTIAGIVAVLYAVGPWSPLHGWIYQFVPFFDLVRAPARAYLWMNLAVAVLAGLAISDLMQLHPHLGLRTRQVLRRATIGLMVVAGVLALVVLPLFYILILGVNDPPNRPVIAVDNLQMLLLFLLLLLGVIWMASRQQLRGAALGVLLVALIVLDVFSATGSFNPTDEDLLASYREPEIAAYLQDHWEETGPFRVDSRHPGLQPNFGQLNGVQEAAGVFDPMQPALYTALVNRLREHPELPGFDMLNIRYLITDDETAPATGFTPRLMSDAGSVLWERENALPRAWFVSTAADVPHESSLDALLDPAFDPSETVIIDGPPVEPMPGASGELAIRQYEPERIVLDVAVDGAGYVVLSEGYFPGWTARVDGERVDVVPANHGLRAIPVEAASGRIELRYEPPLVLAGWLMAAAGGVLVLSALVAPFLARPRR
jgi:hypothetical protein